MELNKEAFSELSKRVDALEERLKGAEKRIEELENPDKDDMGTFDD